MFDARGTLEFLGENQRRNETQTNLTFCLFVCHQGISSEANACRKPRTKNYDLQKKAIWKFESKYSEAYRRQY